MAIHGNSKKNIKEHHVYAIYDAEEEDVFKYGNVD
jgi:URI fold toxin 2